MNAYDAVVGFVIALAITFLAFLVGLEIADRRRNVYTVDFGYGDGKFWQSELFVVRLDEATARSLHDLATDRDMDIVVNPASVLSYQGVIHAISDRYERTHPGVRIANEVDHVRPSK